MTLCLIKNNLKLPVLGVFMRIWAILGLILLAYVSLDRWTGLLAIPCVAAIIWLAATDKAGSGVESFFASVFLMIVIGIAWSAASGAINYLSGA